MKKILKYFGIFLAVSGILLIIKTSLTLNGIDTYEKVFTSSEALQNTSYVLQILSCIFVIFGVIIALWQYTLTSRAEIAKYDNDIVQKAINLSEYYKDNVICKMSIINDVYKKTKILDILDNININNMVNFDTHELETNLSKSQINEISRIVSSDDFWKVVYEVGEVYGISQKAKTIINEVEGDKHILKETIDKRKLHQEFMNNTVFLILNNLEYFAMNFTHKAADESVVYQSLHQTYLYIVKSLYYDISINNVSGEGLYTNAIELFNLWKDKAISQTTKSIEHERRNIEKGTLCKTVK